jgi:phospholipase/carboxylesterase
MQPASISGDVTRSAFAAGVRLIAALAGIIVPCPLPASAAPAADPYMAHADPPVVIETGARPAAAVIWLHGLGADGHDFEPIVPELGLERAAAVRFVFPHAPPRSVTLNQGYVMRAWFDVFSLQRLDREDEEGIEASRVYLEALIREQVDAGIPAGRIVLAGFSQGGAVALHTGLRHAEPLAGILALSTYLPLPHRLAAEISTANATTPVFMAHGSDDPTIPLDLALRSRDTLHAAGIDAVFRVYPMPHTVTLDEIRDVAAWLRRVLGRDGGS